MSEPKLAHDPVGLAAALVNTWDELHEEHERLPDTTSFKAFLGAHGHEEAAADATSRELRAAWRLRDRLRRAWEAPTEDAAVAALNEVVADAHAVPRLVRDWSGRWRFRYGASSWLAAETGIALLDAILTEGWDRFGTCEAPPCRNVFIDRSRNRGRRYCSTACANRAAQAAHRARLRK